MLFYRCEGVKCRPLFISLIVWPISDFFSASAVPSFSLLYSRICSRLDPFADWFKSFYPVVGNEPLGGLKNVYYDCFNDVFNGESFCFCGDFDGVSMTVPVAGLMSISFVSVYDFLTVFRRCFCSVFGSLSYYCSLISIWLWARNISLYFIVELRRGTLLYWGLSFGVKFSSTLSSIVSFCFSFCSAC